MKIRPLPLIALLLALGAILAWYVVGRTGVPTVIPAEPARSEDKRAAEEPPSGFAPPTVAGAALPQASTPVPPARMTSAVTAGLPLVRTTATPVSVLVPLPAALTERLNRKDPQAEVKGDLDNVSLMFRDYRTRLGENPVGSNAEIMKAVMGGNPVNARVGPPVGQNLNDQGELLDRWGSPYFFHQLSKKSMEIRSAGPDQRLWTSDDIVSK